MFPNLHKMRELMAVELPLYCDTYTEELRKMLDMKRNTLKLHLVTINGVIVASRNILIKVTPAMTYEGVGIVVTTMRFKSKLY